MNLSSPLISAQRLNDGFDEACYPMNTQSENRRIIETDRVSFEMQ